MKRILPLLFLISSLLSPGLLLGQTDAGLASYYGDEFAGKATASGELYDPKAFTAAHRTLRFGIRLAVTNPATGKTVTVRINDRGPFVEGRLLDLSKAAAEALGITAEGVAMVEVRVLRPLESVTPEVWFQMGSFRTVAYARALARSLEKHGHPVRVLKDVGLFRVYLVVPEEEAPSLPSQLEEQGRSGFFQLSGVPQGAAVNLSTE